MDAARVVSRDAEVMSGELVFSGTRVPAQSLVDHLKAGHTLDDFLDDFPTVDREQAERFLQMNIEAADVLGKTRSAR